MNFDDTVVSTKARRIDLSRQEGAVTLSVLEQLQGALHRNEMFHQLDLSYNFFNDDCVATISALMKDVNFVVRYDLTSCSLTDKQVSLHLVPALLLKKRVTHLCLDKNAALTDECAEALCRLITETNLTDLSMIGADLTPEGGSTFLQAVVRSSIMVTCKMPFSIGYKLLDAIEMHLDRNRTQFKTLDVNGLHGKKTGAVAAAVPPVPGVPAVTVPSGPTTARRQAMFMSEPANKNQLYTSAPPQKELSGPLALPYIKDGNRDFKGLSPREASHKRLAKATPSRSMINSWADPTVTHTLVSLHMLSERSRLQEQAIRAGRLIIPPLDKSKRVRHRDALLPPVSSR